MRKDENERRDIKWSLLNLDAGHIRRHLSNHFLVLPGSLYGAKRSVSKRNLWRLSL